MLKRNRRLWWSQQKKDVNDVNLQFDNGQSGHGSREGHGRIGPCGSATADSKNGVLFGQLLHKNHFEHQWRAQGGGTEGAGAPSATLSFLKVV